MEHYVELPTYYETEADKNIVSDWTCPEFKVSGAFASHMVVQRETPIKVWGFSQSVGSTVTGVFMRETVKATVGEDNRFILTFAEKAYTDEPQTMTITDDMGHKVVFDDILVGDVWLICGQSNAELHLAPCMELTPNLDFSENDNFRLFYQAQGIAKQNLNHIAYSLTGSKLPVSGFFLL